MATIKKIPAIRFKGFEEGWEEKKLKELTLIKTGFPFDSKTFEIDGEYLVITNGNIQNESSFVDSTLGNRINLFDSNLKEYVLNIDDILVTMDGTVGRTAKVFEKKQILAQRVGRLIANTNAEFLYHYLNTGSFFKKMTVVSHGGTIKHISLLEISTFESYVPNDILEQTQIGDYFKELDGLIHLQERKLKKVSNLKKAMLEKMFPAANADVPEIRFKGFTEKWEKKKLGEVADKIGDGLHGTPQYNENGNVFFINGNNLNNGEIIINNETKCVTEVEQSINDQLLNTETILISINGTIGNLAFYNKEKIMLGKSVAYIILNGINKVFIYAYLQSPVISGFFNDNLTGSTIKNLGLKTIRNTEMLIPSKEEQQKIGEYFLNLNKLINQSQQKITQLKHLKQALLQKMFI